MARVTDPPMVHPAGAPGAVPPPLTPPAAGASPGEPGEGRDGPPSRGSRALARLRTLPRRRWLAVLVVLLVVLFVAAGGLTVALTRPAGPPPLTQGDVDASVRRGIAAYAEGQAAAPADATLAHRAVQPSLVVVSTVTRTPQGSGRGTGAGVVVNDDGTVLTADHVVAGAESVTITFADGTTSPARVATHRPETDTATLTPTRLPGTVVPAVLGGGVQVGTPVFAVGHPLGLTDSLSAGVVSALDRTVTVPGGRRLQHLIQFDAAVNPGNSGGPLLDRSGHVVGIVTGLANPTDETLFVGIGFAVPIATAGGAAGSPPR